MFFWAIDNDEKLDEFKNTDIDITSNQEIFQN